MTASTRKTSVGLAEVLGRGWAFPPEFDQQGGTVLMTSGIEAIEASLTILLTTRLGERVMRPDYGSDLQQFLFDHFGVTSSTHLKEVIRRAILRHEPRIHLADLQIVPAADEGYASLVLTYVVESTGARYDHNIPFFAGEGAAFLP